MTRKTTSPITPTHLIKKDLIRPFLGKLMMDTAVIAPIEVKGDVMYEFANSEDEVLLDYQDVPPFMSIKRFFLPQQDVILKYKKKDKGYEVHEVVSQLPRVIFGTRSCDLAALDFCDKYYSVDYKDKYYFARREETTLINIGCNTPGENCFCIYAQSGPFAAAGFDLQLIDIGDAYLVEVGSEKGKKLIEKYPQYFGKAPENARAVRFELHLTSKSKFNSYVDIYAVPPKLKKDEVPAELWDDMAARCQNCGGCSYICPCCVCFNVVDKSPSEAEGSRVRTWDNCTFEGYTRMAGGHNPRKAKKDRYMRRFYHKLYYELDKFGEIGCVGCGRCTTTCPGRIDMAQVVSSIAMKG
jgi:formate hydrogenlyase subunit 6/NADH:ubiquinone oxidoreductase subunit I